MASHNLYSRVHQTHSCSHASCLAGIFRRVKLHHITHTHTPVLQWEHAQLALTWQADQEPSLFISISHAWLGFLEFGRDIFYLSKEQAAEPLEHHRPLGCSKVVKWVDGDTILRESCLLIYFYFFPKEVYFFSQVFRLTG